MLFRVSVTDGAKVWETEYESSNLFFSLDEARARIIQYNMKLQRNQTPVYIVSFDETPIINRREDFVKFLALVESHIAKIQRAGRLIPWIRRKQATIRALLNDMANAKKFKIADVWSDTLRELADCPFRDILPEHFMKFSVADAKKIDEKESI